MLLPLLLLLPLPSFLSSPERDLVSSGRAISPAGIHRATLTAMPPALYTRRHLLQPSAAGVAAKLTQAQIPSQSPSLAHINVATLEHDRILTEAKSALAAPIAPITAQAAPNSPKNQFFSEVDSTEPAKTSPFRAHARDLRDLSSTVAALCAAYLLTAEETYAQRAAGHIRASLLTPATRLEPTFDHAGCAPGTTSGTPNGIVDLIPLAELSRALVFLTDSPSLLPEEQAALQQWFKFAYIWLDTNRAAGIARDKPDHRGSAWLLLAAAFARYTRDDVALGACRKLFRTPTLRHQIRPDGVFPQEVATPNPYRNTLFNFDLLTGACQLLHSSLDPLWNYELIDGVSLRGVAAYLFPLIQNPERWPYLADAVAFRELPRRRPGLLFTGRAYDRPEYVALWQQLPAGNPPEVLADTFPIREPLLWTTRALHGL